MIFVFVHGTFARGAEWTKSDGLISNALREAFGPEARTVEFNWSGHNWHSERILASKQLGQYLHSLIRQEPDVKFVLLGHSHGGNVCRYVLSDRNLQEHCLGLVALGTPFLEVEPRQVQGVEAAIMVMGITAVSALSLWAGSHLSLLDVFLTPIALLPREVAVWVLGFLGLAIIGGGLWLTVTLFELVAQRVHRGLLFLQERHYKKLTCCVQPFSVPVLHVTTQGDEAFNYLTTLTWVSEIPFRIWRGICRYAGAFVIAAVVLPGFVLGVLGVGPSRGPPILDVLRLVVLLPSVVAIGGALVGPLLIWLLMAFVPRLVRATRIGFGGEGVLDNLLCRISLNNSAGGTNETEIVYLKLDPMEAEKSRVSPLSFVTQLKHCRIHSHPAMSRVVVNWIRTLLTT